MEDYSLSFLSEKVERKEPRASVKTTSESKIARHPARDGFMRDEPLHVTLHFHVLLGLGKSSPLKIHPIIIALDLLN